MWAGLVAAMLVFVADVATPMGIATSVGYVLAVALCIRGERQREVIGVATAATVLAVIGVALKQTGSVPAYLVVANRVWSVIAIWITAALVIGAQRRGLARVEAERSKSAAAALFEAVITHTPDAIFLIARDGAIHTANPAAHRMFGWSLGMLVGKNVEELLPEELRDAHREQRAGYLAAPSARAMGRGPNLRARKRDGGEILIECVIAPAGVGDLVLASVRDVTERRRFEERQRASQRLEAIGRLAGGIAHDFNNLLAVIINCGGFLRRQHAESEDLDDILGAAQRGADLTKQLLAFSRRQIIAPRRVDLNTVVSDVEKMLTRILGEDIDLVTRPSAPLWTVEVDPAQLEQILLNLVVNARDAMPDGGKLTLETVNVVLDADYAASHPDVTPGEYVMLAASDSGVGMTEEVRNRAFEPFFTTKPPGSGSGLGLATVYGIVKQAAGHVWVYSEPGRGTTFKVYFPRATGAPERLDPIRESSRPRGGSERILVVEDDPPVRRVIVRALRDAGYEIIEASNGLEALRKLELAGGELSLVVTDVVMPQMGGREVAEKIAATHPGTKVLFLSGYTENAIVHRGVLDPGLVFLAKPFTEEELLRRVRELLDAR